MDLYLHIGTEKTGSSYLQTLMARNRTQLQREGIFFPALDKRDKDMLAGKISPGNGKPLYLLLSDNDWDGIRQHLGRLKLEATAAQCHMLLLSNEWLLRPLSQPDKLESIVELAKEVGFNKVQMLLYLRNPVDQALSLYKHRAKRGNVPDITEWIKKGYTLPHYLRGLMSGLPNRTDCIFREYRKDGDYMARTLFVDWLGINTPKVPITSAVNPSLSLSELQLIKVLRLIRPGLAEMYYNYMLRIPYKSKAKDVQLEAHYKEILNFHLSKEIDVWEQLNQYLPDGEHLEIPDEIEDSKYIQATNLVLMFSSSQAEMLAHFMDDSLRVSTLIKLLVRNLRRQLGQIFRKK